MSQLLFEELDKKYALKTEELYKPGNIDVEGFNSTKDIPLPKGIERVIGQDEHIKEIREGIEINEPGYNILLCGESGIGKTLIARLITEEIAKNAMIENVDQIAYYNFKYPKEPKIATLPTGKGKELKKELYNFLIELKEKIKEKTKPEILEKLVAEEKEKINKELEKEAEKNAEEKSKLQDVLDKHGYALDRNGTPYKKGSDKFAILPKELEKAIKKYNEELNKYDRKALELEKEADKIEKNKEAELATKELYLLIGALKEEYKNEHKICEFFNDMVGDIKSNISKFLPNAQAGKMAGVFFLGGDGDNGGNDFSKYDINVMVDKSDIKGMPFEFIANPTYADLFGAIESDIYSRNRMPAHMRLKAGKLAKNNRGVLIIDWNDMLFFKDQVREWLLDALENQKAKITSIYVTDQEIEPEYFEAKTKVILCADKYAEFFVDVHGNERVKKLFKKIIPLNSSMPDTLENRLKYAQFAKSEAKEIEFSKEAVGRLIEYSTTFVGKDSLSLKLDDMAEILTRASHNTKKQSKKEVEASDISDAINALRNERNHMERKIYERIKNGQTFIGDEPETGVINGLSVYGVGVPFGVPSRVTATITKGNKYLNIEKESGLSGEMFTKGFEEVISLLYNEFASKNQEIKANIRLSFSQEWGKIDGPSASAAEFDVIASELSNIPIYPHVFMTGAIDPKGPEGKRGKVLPIGGVNEKIKAAYQTCKIKGWKDGIVIVPKANILDVQIDDAEMREAIAKKEFRIYWHDNYMDGLEAATRMPRKSIYKEIRKNIKRMK